jgi:uncharacterized membrane protein
MSDPRETREGGENASGDGARDSGRGRRWLLIGSLALNLFVVAWLLAAALHWSGVLGPGHWGMGRHAGGWADGGPAPHWQAGPDPGARGFVRPRGFFHDFLEDRGDQEDRERGGPMRAIFAEHGPGLRAAFQESRDARRRLHDLMERAEESGRLDKPALADALAAVRRSTQAVQERGSISRISRIWSSMATDTATGMTTTITTAGTTTRACARPR